MRLLFKGVNFIRYGFLGYFWSRVMIGSINSWKKGIKIWFFFLRVWGFIYEFFRK